MLLTALQYALIITFIFVCYSDGMILSPLRLLLERIIAATGLPQNGKDALRKPLFDCNICMSGIYTIALWFMKDHRPLSLQLLWMICLVGGINVILSPFIEGAVMEYLTKLTKDK